MVFILVVAMVREGIEDWARHKNDNKMNSDKCVKVDSNGKKSNHEWRNIQVGDILFLENNERFPTDLVIIASSFSSGLCYI